MHCARQHHCGNNTPRCQSFKWQWAHSPEFALWPHKTIKHLPVQWWFMPIIPKLGRQKQGSLNSILSVKPILFNEKKLN